ncbi:MAG: Crp/Fnr family transcriptional regulator [Pseudomonadota bacterium]
MRRHEFIVREGEHARQCCILISGFAMRHKVAGNGLRQIFSIHMAGDAVDLHNALLGLADHNVEMLSKGEAAFISTEAIRELALAHPVVGMALWRETLVEAAIFREWTLNVGRRDARSRMSHLLCEFALRLEQKGLGEAVGYELPMTQEELGDALALTPIHVSRTLKLLVDMGLVMRTNRSVRILDWHALAKLGDFNAEYLHLSDHRADGPPQALPPLSRTASPPQVT